MSGVDGSNHRSRHGSNEHHSIESLLIAIVYHHRDAVSKKKKITITVTVYISTIILKIYRFSTKVIWY